MLTCFAWGEGNIALADLKLASGEAEQFVSSSSKRVFNIPGMVNVKTTEAVANGYNQFHSEMKILQEILDRYGSQASELEGELTIYSERAYCNSCLKCINAFKTKFPHLNIKLMTSNLTKNISAP